MFTIDGQVYSSSSSLDCLQGVRCSSPDQDWTCLVLDQEGDGENNGESDDEIGEDM